MSDSAKCTSSTSVPPPNIISSTHPSSFLSTDHRPDEQPTIYPTEESFFPTKTSDARVVWYEGTICIICPICQQDPCRLCKKDDQTMLKYNTNQR